eukprot:331668-Prymnesium_polylepis.2
MDVGSAFLLLPALRFGRNHVGNATAAPSASHTSTGVPRSTVPAALASGAHPHDKTWAPKI